MAAQRLNNTPRSYPRFAVVGLCRNQGSSSIVSHVALLRDKSNIQLNETVDVWQQSPPLVVGPSSLQAGNNTSMCKAHLVAWLELNDDEYESMDDWLFEVDIEQRPSDKYEQYFVHPHVIDQIDGETGTRLYRRFSCVGVVIECYRGAAIELLNIDESIPEAELQGLCNVNPGVRRADNRERYGLSGTGPWKVILPGYIIHAFHNRTDAEIRSTPYTITSIKEAEFD